VALKLKKLANYPRQNGPAKALRDIGKIERSLFGLDRYQDVELRRRVNAGLNKGEARNALARAVFFNRLGELRDRSHEDQQGHASGLALLTAAQDGTTGGSSPGKGPKVAEAPRERGDGSDSQTR
jgi:TnpA family transposase